MSALLLVSLCIQTASLAIVFYRVRRRWLSYTGALFVFISFIFYGFNEILQSIFPGMNEYRNFVDQEDIDSWVFIVSIAVFLFSVVYSLTLNRDKIVQKYISVEDSALPTLIDWRIAIILFLPLYTVATAGSDQEAIGYWLSGLSGQFLVIGVTLTSIAYVFKKGDKSVIVILIIQSVMISLIGSRNLIFVCAIMLLSVLYRYRIRVNFRAIMITIICVLFFSTAISAARVAIGRGSLEESGITGRASGLIDGLKLLTGNDSKKNSIAEDFVYRIDGNSYSALVYRSLKLETPPAGLRPFVNNIYLIVPSFLNPQKFAYETSVDLDEEAYMVDHYRLPPNIDFLPTTFGIIYGYYGYGFLFIMAILLGFLFAKIDKWLQTSRSLFSLFVGVGVTYCVLSIEAGVKVYFIGFRGIFVIFLLYLAATRITVYFKKSLGKSSGAEKLA